MFEVWQVAGEAARQTLGYLPALAFNLVLYWVTGAVLWLAFGGRAGPPARRMSVVALVGLLALLWLGFLALVLALVGAFSPWRFAALWVLSMALGLGYAWRTGRYRGGLHDWRAAAPLPGWLPWLLLLWLALYTRPFELIVGGRDPGIYVNTAAQIAEQGGLAVADPFFAQLTSEDQARLVWRPPWLPEFVPHKLPGFFWLADRGEVLPQFVPFYPALLAVSYAALGFPGALTVLPFVSLLFALVLAELAVELFSRTDLRGSRWSAGLAAGGLLLNPAGYWFGRYANSDVLFGLFVFAALLLWARAAAADEAAGPGRQFCWTLAALSFGAALLTKIDSWYVAPAAVAALLIYHPTRRGRGGYAAGCAWGVAVACYLYTVARYSYPYMLGIMAIEGVSIAAGRSLAMVAAGGYVGALTAVSLLPAWPGRARLAAWGRGLHLPDAWLPGRGDSRIVALMCVGLTGFFAWSLPSGTALLRVPVILAAYLGWPLLLLSPVGVWRLVRRSAHRRLAVGLLILFFTSGLFIIERTPWVDHPWAIRRAVSIAIPALVLFAVFGLDVIRTRLGAALRRLGPLGPIAVNAALAAGVLLPLARRDVPIFRHMEVAGAHAELALLETVFPADAVILADSSQMMNLFGPALGLDGREILAHFGGAGDPPLSPALRDRVAALAAGEGRPFFFVTELDAPPLSAAYPLARYWWDEWPETRLVSRAAPLPLTVEITRVPFRVYQALGSEQPGSVGVIARYEAEALPGLVGQRTQDADAQNGWARVAQAGEDAAGVLVYGPYQTLAAGRYEARFTVRTLAVNGTAPAQLAVQGAQAGLLVTTDAPAGAGYAEVVVPFELSAADTLEFIVNYRGAGAVWVDRIEVLAAGAPLSEP